MLARGVFEEEISSKIKENICKSNVHVWWRGERRGDEQDRRALNF